MALPMQLANPGPTPYPLTTTVTVRAKSNWTEPLSYLIDFGDGSAPVASTTPKVDHTYTRSGKFTITAGVSGADGKPSTISSFQPVVVNEPGLPQVAFEAKHCAASYPDSCYRPLAFVIDTTGTTAPWPLDSFTVDYGDGSAPTGNLSEPHLYAAPGDYKITVTAKDKGGQTGSLTKTVAIGYQPARFTGCCPERILDTRTGVSPVKVGSGEKVTVRAYQGGWGGWRDNAIVLNVTAVLPSGDGFLTVAPGGTPRPTSSNINYTKGSIVPNLVTVPVGPDGTVAIWNSGAPVDIVVDRIGAYNPDYGSYFNPVTPRRVVDTRDGTGVNAGKLKSVCYSSATPPTKLNARTLPGVPADATDVVLNVTVTEPEQPGYLSINSYTGTSNLNFAKGETVANQVIAAPDSEGMIWFCTGAGSLHVVADISGYYSPSSSGSVFTPVPPVRLTDTREDPAGSLKPEETRAVATKLPAGATGAVLNVTAARSTTGSYLTLWGDGTTRPGTSNVNFPPGRIVANHVTTPLGTNGKFDIYNRSGDTDAVVDMFGYFSKP
ncbi:PKD domain-containing protein [Kitasatospora gansuensis]